LGIEDELDYESGQLDFGGADES
ncbi:hypothetical protein Tco_1442566, partial [Tanacetum coccineum]